MLIYNVSMDMEKYHIYEDGFYSFGEFPVLEPLKVESTYNDNRIMGNVKL